MLIIFLVSYSSFFFFFFNDTATTEIYTLSLHDALPILCDGQPETTCLNQGWGYGPSKRSEEHTSELQSQSNLVCRLLLEKKKQNKKRKPQLNKKQNQQHSTQHKPRE